MGSDNALLGPGTTLAALPGNQISDGSTFVVNGPVTSNGSTSNQNVTFTFRSGFTLTAPNGGGEAVVNGETFTVNGSTYQLTLTPATTPAGETPVPYTTLMTPDEIASTIFQIVQATNPTVKVFLDANSTGDGTPGSSLEFQGVTVTQSSSHSLVLSGSCSRGP